MKKIILSILFILIVCSCCNYALASVEDDLSVIDKNRHSASQFRSILNTIQKYYSKYNNQEIGDWIAHAWNEVHKELPDISIYQVAVEIEEMVIEADGAMKLNEVMATYIVMRPSGY